MHKDAHKQIKHLILGACCALALPGMAAAADDNKTLLILDYSLSMWSHVEGKPRYQVMRDVINENLPPLDGKLSLGLIGYGHRMANSCSDHKVLIEPDTLNATTFRTKLNRLKPNGRAPLARSMSMASKALGETSPTGHIIVVTDGRDNCSGDPCTQARLIHEANANVKIHVIAFSASQADTKKLSCINLQTKGEFFSVTNKATLSQAVKATLALAAKQTPLKITPDATPIAEATPPIPKSPPANKLAAAPVPPIAAPVPRPRLGPRLIKAIKLAQLNRVPIPRDPPRGRPFEPMVATAQTMVAAPITTGSIKRQPIAQSAPASEEAVAMAPSKPEPQAAMPASLPNPHAASIIKPSFSITPKDGGGKQGIALKAQISASLKTIERKVQWSVYKIDDAAKNKWRKVAEKNAPTASFDLKQGDYVVRSGFGHANAAIMVSVEPGKIADATVIFNAGGLRIRPSLAFLDIPKDKSTTLSLIRLGTPKDNEVVTDIVAEKIIRLNAGTYELTSQFGSVNAITKTQIIIKPGLLTDVEINHKAALVNFKLAAKAGGEAIAPASWHLLSKTGALLKKTSTLSPSHILAPGDYKITAIRGSKSYTSTFSLNIGETKSVELLAK